ncbi:MAG: hypothetical protein AVDCRST_MAG80-2318 [uncultured Rubrobacteraceae bacterium]|uniref:Uncharacterized protein n=1 Tax=uncultured Rubrobacteraceae bacterium TaxID=349277 RepID=A0A6J4QZX2_9ACTN|nr:MAG: hypothetical protein AVDCRST_MAG80-2318 [uncultured Rubrobacteraceae bacterium]
MNFLILLTSLLEPYNDRLDIRIAVHHVPSSEMMIWAAQKYDAAGALLRYPVYGPRRGWMLV